MALRVHAVQSEEPEATQFASTGIACSTCDYRVSFYSKMPKFVNVPDLPESGIFLLPIKVRLHKP